MRFLFVDRILHLSSDFVQGIKHVTPEDHYLCQDSNGKVKFIPSLIGETLGQLAAWSVMFHNDFISRPVAGVVANATLYRPAYVGETILLESYIDSLDETAVRYHSVARVGDEIIFQIEDALGPLLPMKDFIAQDVVRQQFSEIYRPLEQPCERFSSQEPINFSQPLNTNSLKFDRILSCDPGVKLSAEKRITLGAPYFPDHFPNKPVLPMTVLLECKLNLVYEFLAQANFPQKYQVQEFRKMKMNEFVHPGDIVICELSVKKHEMHELILNFRSEVNNKRVCVLDVVLRAKA
jgi:3-hydroxymyristoyl/3-hydroxydecanoyl-(acyl carrier protein) dehydratase